MLAPVLFPPRFMRCFELGTQPGPKPDGAPSMSLPSSLPSSPTPIPSLAERFLLHVDIAASKSARSYERHCNALGLDPIDPADLQRLETRRRALIARFGKIYDEDWGWASPLVPAKTVGISFSDLERVAGFDHLRPYYLLGCHRVHGGSMGVELGLLDFRGQSTLLVGPSNDGLTDAGHGSLISLSNVTISLLRQRIEGEPLNLMTMQTILRLVDLAGDAFAETQAELTNREREIESAAQAGSVLILAESEADRRSWLAGWLLAVLPGWLERRPGWLDSVPLAYGSAGLSFLSR